MPPLMEINLKAKKAAPPPSPKPTNDAPAPGAAFVPPVVVNGKYVTKDGRKVTIIGTWMAPDNLQTYWMGNIMGYPYKVYWNDNGQYCGKTTLVLFPAGHPTSSVNLAFVDEGIITDFDMMYALWTSGVQMKYRVRKGDFRPWHEYPAFATVQWSKDYVHEFNWKTLEFSKAAE